MNNRLRTLFLAFTLTVVAAPSHAGIDNQMNKMFGSMSNTTSPGAFETQGRGVLYGGSFEMRNRIVTTPRVISLQMPSLEAGCGGVSAFGGAFSIVNSDQIVETMRAVAANAKGYFFQLAINAVAPDISQVMAEVTKKLDAWNRKFQNSCEMATWLVDKTGAKQLSEDIQQKSELFYQELGLGDAHQAKQNTGTLPQDVQDKIAHGNLLWRSLKEQQVEKWFGEDGNQFLEEMISLVGTVVVRSAASPSIIGPLAPSDSTVQISREVKTLSAVDSRTYNPLISLGDLVKGGEVAMWECVGDTDLQGVPPEKQCLEMKPVTRTIVGLEQRLKDVIFGTTGRPGYIDRLAANAGELDSWEKNVIAGIPHGFQAYMVRLAPNNPGLAKAFARQFTKTFATLWAKDLANQMIDAASVALTIDSPQSQEVVELIQVSRVRVADETQWVQDEMGRLSEMPKLFNELMRVRESRARMMGVSSSGKTPQ